MVKQAILNLILGILLISFFIAATYFFPLSITIKIPIKDLTHNKGQFTYSIPVDPGHFDSEDILPVRVIP